MAFSRFQLTVSTFFPTLSTLLLTVNSGSHPLARMLGQSRSSAEQFAEQVKRIMMENGRRSVSIGRICSAVAAVQNAPITVEEVLEQLGFRERRVMVMGASKNHSVSLESSQGRAPKRLPDARPDDSPPVPDEVDIEDLQEQALALLMGLQAEQVTYAQAENAMVEVGLDPGQNEDSYAWLIDQLDQHSILVVDQVIDASETAEDLETDAIKYSHEISQALKRILASGDDQQLLTLEEQRRLVEIYQSGQEAQEKLAELDENLSDVVEQALRSRIADGEKALETLLWRNRRLVVSIALKYIRRVHHLELDDLFQEGMLGLQRAIERFDLETGLRLSTYATWWIRQAVTRAIADQERTIRFPVHMVETINQYRKAHGELSQEHDREPTDLEIAARMNRLSPGTLAQVMDSLNQGEEVPDFLRWQIDEAIRFVRRVREMSERHTVSLNQVVRDETGSELGDLLQDDHTESPEELAIQSILKDEIRDILSSLTDRQRQVLIMRYGLNGGEEMTLDAIGQEYGVTRERIRQIQATVLDRLEYTA